MTAGRQLKLPRSFFRTRVPPPAFRPPTKVFTAKMVANFGAAQFGSGTDGRRAAVSTIRKVLLQDLATAIVDDLRAAHINITMGYEPTIKGWKQYRAEGQLDDKVAILVDGSPQRPIKNVKFAGSIQIVSPASLELIAEAAKFAWEWMIRYSNKLPSGKPPKKNNSYSYKRSFEMFISDKRQISGPGELKKPGAFDDTDWVTIHNYVPYAAKLERYYFPHGVFWLTFKKLRAKYGRNLALRFEYVKSIEAQHNVTNRKSGASIPLAQPVIRIGQPGAFPSSVPNMKKFIRDSARPRENRKVIRRGRNWKAT